MNATQLLAHFDRLSEAPGAVPRLRRFILDLAARGKLTGSIGVEDQMTTLGNLADFIMGQAPPGHTCNEIGEGTLFVKVGEFGVRYPEARAWTTQPLRFAQAGDVLVCVVGATVGKLNLAVDCAIGRSVAAIRPSERIRTEYLYYSLMPFTLRLRDSARGSAQGVISKPALANIKLWCPSLDEQEVVVSKVNELMALCDQLEATQQERERRRDRLAAASLQRLNQPGLDTPPEAQREHARFHLHHLPRLTTRPEHIKAMREIVLDAAFQGTLTTQDSNDGNGRDLIKSIVKKSFNAIVIDKKKSKKTSVGIEVDADPPFPTPATWGWASLQTLCEQIGDIDHKMPRAVDIGVPFLSARDLKDGGLLDFSNPKYISEEDFTRLSRKVLPKRDDIIYSRIGARLGKARLVEVDARFLISYSCCLIRPKHEFIDKRYLQIFLDSHLALQQAHSGVQSIGVPDLGLGEIKAYRIPVPPLAEQHRIVAKVNELMTLCDQLEAQLTTTQTDSRRLLEAVLEAALTPD